MSHSNSRDIGSETLVRGDIAAAGGAVATSVGRGTNIAALPGGARANSIRAHIAVRGNLDSADTYVVDNIKLVSDSASNFAGAVTRVTAADVTLTGTATSDVDYFSDVDLDLDLGQLPESHVWLRVSARHTLLDTTNTNGTITATLIFGGLSIV